MSKQKHTSGPWHIEASANQATWICAGRKHIATIMDRDLAIDEDARIQEANARLIAAAPELLEACKFALPHHQGGHSQVGFELKAAIAKAEGK